MIKCKEYALEEGKPVDISKLLASQMDIEDYTIAHRHLPLICHDVLINYEGGILLVMRNRFPAKGILWGFGGRLKRGLSLEESLKRTVKEESNLDIHNSEIIGLARHYWATEPFGHGHGTDTPVVVYYGEAEGDIRLNKDHYNPLIVKPEAYTERFKQSLHPYMKDFMDLVIPKIK